ncbi:protein KINESIN LIGHT CHAIN-RELATED 3-like [Silene latifolia]|uniref:protein KINESIN LIGHT CHAIN-RELATED 3-like n=1 Tax=Silene latifolia TaxID=37657 RepID=UPI003D7897B9
MKRLSTKLISSSKITTSSTSISSIQSTTCFSSSISKSPIQNLKPWSNYNALFYKPYKTHQLYKNPSQDYTTHVGIRLYFPSNEGKNKEIIQEAIKAVKAAKLVVEVSEIFKEMEGKFDKAELGAACLNIGLELEKEGEDPQKIRYFGTQALNVLDTVDNIYYVAMTLRLLGSINCGMRKFNDALGFLNRARNIVVKLENDGNYKYGVNALKTIHLAVCMELANVETVMGRSKEAVDYSRKCLEINECLMGVDSVEFGDANRDFAEVCVTVKNFKDGLLYCKKALEIHLKLLGENSLEVGLDRWLFGVIYAGMEEHEKALEENKLAQKVFKDCGCRSELIRSVVDAANVYIGLGRYEAAMKTLKEHEKGENPLILMTVGKVFIHQQNVKVAKECLEFACRVLNKMEKSKPLEVADAYIMIADQYETMNDVETAIFLLLRALALLEKLFEEKRLKGSVLTRIGCLLLLTDKVTRAMTIPHLEKEAETLKQRYGSKHFGVGYICNKLGRAYLELERPELAAEMFVVAKDILGFYLGPQYESIHTCQNLSNAYAAMYRWSKCKVSSEIVRHFKSSMKSEIYLVQPTPASLSYHLPIINVDSNFPEKEKEVKTVFQVGAVCRSREGFVLWAVVAVFNVDSLVPPSLAMKKPDINLPELGGIAYLRILTHEMGIGNFLLVTDSKLSHDYLTGENVTIKNKLHRFLVVLCKKIWFYSPQNEFGRRALWVDKIYNKAADALSRRDKIKDFPKAIEDDLPEFKRQITEDISEKNGGTGLKGNKVLKGKKFITYLKESVDKIRKD